MLCISHTNIVHLAIKLRLLLQLPSIFHSESVLEDLSNVFESHTLDFRIAEVDCDPTEETDSSIKPKCTCERLVCGLGGVACWLT